MHLLFLIAILVILPISCKKDDEKKNNSGGGTKSGTYMGIIGFNNDVFGKKIGILNPTTKQSYKSFIDGMVMQNNTALYHAVFTAINWLEAATLPADLENIAIVTFTDGRDNNSQNLNKDYDDKPIDEYGKDVKKRIDKLSDKFGDKVKAYSIGLTGKEIYTPEEKEEFKTVLNYLADNEDNVIMVDFIEGVKEEFQRIANSIYKETNFQTIKFEAPRRAVEVSKYRFTFDLERDFPNGTISNCYIEGDWNRSNNSLTNVKYMGVSCDNGETVQGVATDTKVTFSFRNLKIDSNESEIDKNKTNLYTLKSSNWSLDSEFKPDNIDDKDIEQRSAVIMLVLDCSSSLGNDFSSMQSAANSFIDILSSGSGGGGGGGNTGFVIDAKNVLDGSSSIKTAKANLFTNFSEDVIASGEYLNGGFKITLPRTLSNDYLQNDWKNWMSVSDRYAKISQEVSFTAHALYDEHIGYFSCEGYANDYEVYLYYVYADRNFNVKGEPNWIDPDLYTYDLSLQKGWNAVYYIHDYRNEDVKYTKTTQKPSNITMKWYFSENDKNNYKMKNLSFRKGQ